MDVFNILYIFEFFSNSFCLLSLSTTTSSLNNLIPLSFPGDKDHADSMGMYGRRGCHEPELGRGNRQEAGDSVEVSFTSIQLKKKREKKSGKNVVLKRG